MECEPGSRGREWVVWMAMIGGLILGGLVADLATGAFLQQAGFFAHLAVWALIVVAFGLGGVVVITLRFRRLDAER